MQIEVSNGEIVDKITILKIKSEKITDEVKLKNVNTELNILLPLLDIIGIAEDSIEFTELFDLNHRLWVIEDKLRLMEKEKKFDNEFIDFARLVYYTNDKRFKVKSRINKITNSQIIEEKEYHKYD